MLDSVAVSVGDTVIADDDRVVFLRPRDADHVLEVAARIQDVETRQAELVRSGRSLRQRLDFAVFAEVGHDAADFEDEELAAGRGRVS